MVISIEKSPSDRGGYRLTTQLLLPGPREKVFEFFADAFQLEMITPPWLHFSVLTPHPIVMRDGLMIDYKLRLHGLPLRWRSRISCWEPCERFVDEQVRGPYRYWHHLHTFDETNEGTLVRDIVDYAIPLGFLTHPLLVRRDLIRIFNYRHEMLSRIWEPIANAHEVSPIVRNSK